MLPVYRFQPYGLPDAGNGSVPDASRIGYLLAAGLRAFVGRIPDAYGKLLLSACNEVTGDIEREGVVSATVHAQLFAVQVNFRFPVYRPEMQQYPFPFPAGRYGK